MITIPVSIIRQINNPHPDIKKFVSVIKGAVKPDRVHLAELFADQEVMRWVTEELFKKQWVPLPDDFNDREQMQKHWLCEIEYWHRMGYDYIRVWGGLNYPQQIISIDNTAEMAKDRRQWAITHNGPIQTWDDFERYPWPTVSDDSIWIYEFVAKHLPDGMGIMVCPLSGFLEIPMHTLVGYESLAMMVHDQPELVKAIFAKVRENILGVNRRALALERVAGVFQGDDMGFRSGLLFSADFLKEHSLNGHKAAAELAHARGKIYMLHACGNLASIIDYLIDEVKIDAKHSFEDVIIPVDDFYSKYGDRVACLGGVDVDLLGRADETTVRQRVRKILDTCMRNGRYALGSGNTIANYCKMENVLAMFDEAFSWKP